MSKLYIELSGKNALVTGGSRGVGRATVQLLASAGARVGFTYQSREADASDVLAMVRAAGGDGWIQQADFVNESSVDALFAVVDREFPEGLDIFVANAGVWPPEDVPVEEMSSQQWRQTLAINLDAVFYGTREAGKRLRRGGRIVYVGSTAGQRGEAYHLDYAATKGALISMVKGLCVEFAGRDATVNCVAPGWIDTEMSSQPYAGEGRLRIEQSIPLGRVASAEDVAWPIVFLCTSHARHITGEVLNINGGAVLCG